jgi:hypothetical protein
LKTEKDKDTLKESIQQKGHIEEPQKRGEKHSVFWRVLTPTYRIAYGMTVNLQLLLNQKV